MPQDHPRDCCQSCGKKMYGGDNCVSVLPNPFMSFHVVYHLSCFTKMPAEDQAEFIEACEHNQKMMSDR